MIKLTHLLKEYQKEYLDVLLDKISAKGIKSLTSDEMKFLKSYSKAEKPYQVKNEFIPFDYVKIGSLAKFKKDKEAEYKIIDKFYGSEYDEEGVKYDNEREIASFRDTLKNSTPIQLRIAGLEGENFDDIEFVVIKLSDGRNKIYRYAYPNQLYVPEEN